MVTKISTSKIIHDEIKMINVLERSLHVNEEWVIQGGQNPTLVEDWVNIVLLDYSESTNMYFCFEIYFIAYYLMVSLLEIFHTLPNPPKPIW